MREFDLLNHIYAANSELDGRVVIPPGDDMALIRVAGAELLVAIDQLVEGRHYDARRTSVEQIGYKAIARSVSDVAAMAARPVASLVAASLPPDFGDQYACKLFDAMRSAASKLGCPIVGGDVSVNVKSRDPLVCAVTVLATPGAPKPVTRSGAQVGDSVFVTGSLGGARSADNLGRHLSFTPRVAEAIDLAETLGDRLHAMIDISDGLGRDLAHVATRSLVKIELDANRIPHDPGIDWKTAVSEGEDYELCFTAVGEVPDRIGDLAVTQIGWVTDSLPELDAESGPPVTRIIIHEGDEQVEGDAMGWQHES